MANGGPYDKAVWARIEAPLIGVDPLLEDFARKNGLSVSKNSHNSPERSITWNAGPNCLIQLYPVAQDPSRFSLWICASEDRGGERYWKEDSLVEDQPMEAFEAQLPELLDDGLRTLASWCEDTESFDYVGEAPR